MTQTQRASLKIQRIGWLLFFAFGAAWAQTPIFKQPVVVPTGTWPAAIVAADTRANGVQDLVYVDHGATSAASTTHVLLNDGKGNFAAGATVATAGTSIIVSDLAQGQKPSLLWASVNGSTVSLYSAVSNGDGTYAATTLMSSLTMFGSNTPVVRLAVTGFPADERRAVLVEDIANSNLYEVFTNPDGSHGLYPAAGTPGTLTNGANQMIVQDLNGDGVSDVIVQGANAIEVIKGVAIGEGEVAFSAPAFYPIQANSMLLYNVDNDSFTDLVVEGANGGFNVYHGNGDGTFATTSEGGTAAQGLDGTTGYGGTLIGASSVGTKRNFYTANPAGFSVLLGQGNITYALQGIYDLGPGRTSFALADFNGDGYPDVAVDSPLGIAIGYGQADASMDAPKAFATGQPAYSIAPASASGTQIENVFVATGVPQVQLMANDGAGNFSMLGAAFPGGAAETNAGRTLWSNVTFGNFNGTTGLQAAVTLEGEDTQDAAAQGLMVAVADGTDYFLTGADVPVLGESVMGDFDEESAVDLLNFDGATASIYRTGPLVTSGLAQQQTVLFTHAGGAFKYDHVATGYFKVDPQTKSAAQTGEDAVVEDGGTFYVFANSLSIGGAQSTFSQVYAAAPPVAYTQPVNGVLPASGMFPGSVVLADLDGDGFGDLVISYGDLASDPMEPGTHVSQTFIYWGDGTGQFSGPTVVTGTRNFAQSQVTYFLPTASGQLTSTDGSVIDVLPFNGRTPNTAAETMYLAGQGINAVYPAAYDANQATTSLYVANGGVTMTSPVVNKGVLTKDPLVNGGGLTVLPRNDVTVNVTGSVVASPNPVLYADNFTLTATVTQPSGGAAPSGTVTFSVGGTVVGTATNVVNGAATLDVTVPQYSAGPPLVTGYIVGSYSVSAQYSGDANYNPTIITGGNLVVDGQPTVSTIELLNESIFYGQEIGYDNGVDALLEIAEQNPGVTSAPLDGGALDVTIDGVVVCATQAGVSQRCPDPPFEGYDARPTPYSMVETYSGNDYFAPSNSPVYPVTVSPDVTTGVLTTSGTPSTSPQSVTFTMTLSAPYATPTGTVTFTDGNTVIGTITVNAQGVATLSTATLSVGTHQISASYVANTNRWGAVNFLPVSQTIVQVVQGAVVSPLPTATIVTSSLNPSVVGQSVTFTASVGTTGAFVAIPTGTVQFFDGATSLGTATLGVNATATLTTSTLIIGTHPITAVYAGSSTTTGSTSAVLQQIVYASLASAGDTFLLMVSPSTLTLGVGASGVLTVTVTELNGFNQPVQLSCSGIPSEGACAFGVTTIPAGGGATTLTVSVAAPHNCGTGGSYFIGSAGSRGLLGLMGALSVLLFARKRKMTRMIAVLIALVGLSAMGGCGGNCTDLGTLPGNYTLTVTGTAAPLTVTTSSSSVTQSVKVPLVVKI